MNDKLVSIGIPAYNRPEGLRKNLECLIKQTYENIEIIVSDDCSPNPDVALVINEFVQKDSRIKYYRHTDNFGPAFNHKFVLSRASGNYFMWSSDDDYFISENLIEELVKHAPNHILCFSDFVFSNNPESTRFYNTYKSCDSKLDYIKAILVNGVGVPILGMYNLKRLKENNIELNFEDDLEYYNEGPVLHKLFLTGKVKFVPNVYIYYDLTPPKQSAFKLCLDYIEFYNRSVNIFYDSNLTNDEKKNTLQIMHQYNSSYLYGLFSQLNPQEKQTVFYKILEKSFIRI
jgi:glycosyltransferase involved in cell wall biosynthesis